MGRQVKFGEQELTLNLIGVTAFFALKQSIHMSYQMIKHVSVDYFDAPLWMLRMPGTSISPLHIYEGSYRYRNEWYFLSYERWEPLVIIELERHTKYDYVIFQIDHPNAVASKIRMHSKN
ncbi:hypothetical protein [Domibacillus mangrovi]|uniref:Bacterial Pleckstrin homology domain-containing protein n=1 Tax=Domibacillus mangrovi TaxID=1714354 RepID=A0A1Q5P514_9BACI|nr:hypothetical protein [Domibacillus mangrovi]OKL37369.1 hypothetical protein BLL40_07305 [Domibacillus mangrovi]